MVRVWLDWWKQGLLLNLCSNPQVAKLTWLLELKISPETNLEWKPVAWGLLTSWCHCPGTLASPGCAVTVVAHRQAVHSLSSLFCAFAVLPGTYTLSGSDTAGTSSQASSSPAMARCFAFVQKWSFHESTLSPEREKQNRMVCGQCQVHTGLMQVFGRGMEGTRDPGAGSPCSPSPLACPFQGTMGAWNRSVTAKIVVVVFILNLTHLALRTHSLLNLKKKCLGYFKTFVCVSSLKRTYIILKHLFPLFPPETIDIYSSFWVKNGLGLLQKQFLPLSCWNWWMETWDACPWIKKYWLVFQSRWIRVSWVAVKADLGEITSRGASPHIKYSDLWFLSQEGPDAISGHPQYGCEFDWRAGRCVGLGGGEVAAWHGGRSARSEVCSVLGSRRSWCGRCHRRYSECFGNQLEREVPCVAGVTRSRRLAAAHDRCRGYLVTVLFNSNTYFKNHKG